MLLKRIGIIFAFTLGMSVSAHAQLAAGEVGFQSGNNFVYNTFQFWVTVSCHDGIWNDSGLFNCEQTQIVPEEFDYFVGPNGVSAESVRLNSTWNSGKSVEKTQDYDSVKGRSKKRFNLFAATLLQRPLLSEKTTIVSYELIQQKSVVASGQFKTNLKLGKAYSCPRQFVNSFNRNDCRFGSYACTQARPQLDQCN